MGSLPIGLRVRGPPVDSGGLVLLQVLDCEGPFHGHGQRGRARFFLWERWQKPQNCKQKQTFLAKEENKLQLARLA